MSIEQVIASLESRQTDPEPAIETLIAAKPASIETMLARLKTLRIGQKIPHRIERLYDLLNKTIKAERLAARRMAIALGAIQAREAIPTLLDLLAYSSFDRKLNHAIGWSLANMGEAAVMPLFLFARCRDLLASARSLAITTLGYIADPRVPSILRFLWREVRLERPALTIATLIGTSMREGIDEARKLAQETEQLWHFHGSRDEYLNNYWINLEFEASINILKMSLERAKQAQALPTWSKILCELEAG